MRQVPHQSLKHEVKSVLSAHIGLVSQTGLRLSQELFIVLSGHLSSFYKYALDTNITGVHRVAKQ